jgi:hypothetical protein
MHQGPSIPDGDFQRLHDILRGWRYDLQLNPHGMYADDVRIIIRPLAAVRWEHGFAAHAAIDEAGYANVLYAQPGVTLPAPPSVSPATSDEYDTPR